MGVDTRRPPLPAPTDTTSMDETSPVATEVATNVTTRTDKTSYTIPEDGSPIIISTHKKESRIGSHGRQKSQTSLLIEYFEGSKTGDKTKGRPSVRVKVTPSSRKSSSHRANDAVQITSIGSDRKPSYTRRISLSSKNVETGAGTTELSHSSESNVSGPLPVEIELLNNGSDLSRSSRGLMMAPNESNVSSMPPDSLIDGHAASNHVDDEDTITKDTHLAAPQRRRSRSTSRERITQRVMEKLGQTPVKHRKADRYESQHRSSKAHRDDDLVSAESSLLSSNPVSSQRSYQSNNTQASRVTNNARLLEKVEDTIKRILLPEITAIRDDQRAERSLRTFDSTRKGGDYEHSLERRVSKSSSSPNIKSKPKVVLNREGDDPGTVLSRGDSEYKKTRKTSGERTSSRRSSTHRKSDGYDEDVRRKSSKGDIAKMAAAGLAGAALTTAALKHHDSEESDLHHRRKRRSKSRGSRSTSNSIVDGAEEAYTRKQAIPPMPMASHINDSDLTRTSLLSTDDDQHDEQRQATRMPVREVSRGSIGAAMSPVSSRTPTRTPVGKAVGMTHANRSMGSPSSSKSRTTALPAEAEAHERHVDNDGYGRGTQSPAQSVSSLRMQYGDPLVPAGLRPHSSASRTSTERLHKKASRNSATSSPLTRPAISRDLTDEFVTPMEFSDRRLGRDRSQTPSGEDVDEWFKREHLQNEHYRSSLDTAANRTSYQTNPYPEDEKHFRDVERQGRGIDAQEKDIQGVGANPEYVHAPVGVESAVASLIEPSTLSSAHTESPAKATYSDRMAQQLHAKDTRDVAMYEGSTLSQTMPSDNRWAALKRHAHSLSNTASSTNVDALESPRQSPVKSSQGESPIKMVSSGLPLADDPMPEIGVFDDTKSVDTNPSIIKGPLGGDVTGQSTWPYTPSPQLADSRSREAASGYSKDVLLAGAAVGGAARHAKVEEDDDDDDYHDERKLTPQLGHYQEERKITPVSYHDEDRSATPTQDSPAALRDEGYVTDAGARTPKAERREDINEYHRAMDRAGQGDSDPFVTDPRHARHMSGNSHGMESPLYDAARGKGMENIQSKDIVALMDHLTVRDAQRNARDTEILVTLVRNAADMRQNFEEMKRFIFEQDELIMSNTKRGQDIVVQRVLSGPRPQPTGSPRTPRGQSEEDVQVKRRGLLRRALKGLTTGKSSGDLSNIENMLNQVLDNVEQLKHQGNSSRGMTSSYMGDGIDSYEKLRAMPDPGYEADGAAGTDSTPSQSGHFTTPGRSDKQVFHSGYNGRPGSENRVSTVMEGDEDEDLAPHERNVLQHQFENNHRLLTPTQDFRPDLATSPTGLGKQYHVVNDMTSRAAEKQQKHKSNSSSVFGVPKMSRWSKTTTSSAMPESPVVSKNARPISAASRSGSSMREYDDDDYSLQEDDRLRSTQSLARDKPADTRSVRSQASRLTRTPSPLIPSEASYREDDYDRGVSPVQHDDYDPELDVDNPKYHAIRNSIALQHPQPRQGSTNRHQNNLETKAHSYDESMTESDISQRSGSDFDPAQWGSSGAAALSKSRFSQAEPISPVSLNSPHANKAKDTAPLVPSQTQPRPTHAEQDDYDDNEDDDDDESYEPQYSNSGFARSTGPWYSSPLGSGHLLEPIAEVRYSLETDSGRLSPEPQIASARAVTARKITGPRPMGSRSTSAAKPMEPESSGTVRRKPVSGNRASRETLSSQDSETF